MRTSRCMLYVAAVLALACASGASSPEGPATARVAPRPCTVSPPGTDSAWQEVRAEGFTFCVPGSWRPQGGGRQNADARKWRTASGSVTWGTGAPPSREVIVTETVVVRAGELPRPTARADTRRDREMIGGRLAEVREMHFRDLHHTEAVWREPAIYLQGEATSVHVAQLLLVIHRTVRFTTPQSP